MILGEFHAVGGPALGSGAQVRGITEHLRQRHRGTHDLSRGRVFHALHHAAPAVEVAHHVAHVILRRDHLHLHDRLQQDRPGLRGPFLETDGSRDLEGHLARIHLMVGAIVKGNLHVHHREARHDTTRHGLPHTLTHRGDIILGHHTADNLVDELEARARLLGFETQIHMTVLSATAGLADELALLLDLGPDGLAIADLGRAHISRHVELALHAVDDDLQVQLTHAGDDGLARLLVGTHPEGRVFLRQFGQGDPHLLLVALGPGLHRYRDDRLGKLHALQGNDGVLGAEGVAGGHILQADGGGDVTGADLLDLLAVVGVHLQDAAEALPFSLDRVENAVAGLEHPGIDPKEGQGPHKGIGRDLERQGGKGRLIRRRAFLLRLGGIIHDPLDRRHVDG